MRCRKAHVFRGCFFPAAARQPLTYSTGAAYVFTGSAYYITGEHVPSRVAYHKQPVVLFLATCSGPDLCLVCWCCRWVWIRRQSAPLPVWKRTWSLLPTTPPRWPRRPSRPETQTRRSATNHLFFVILCVCACFGVSIYVRQWYLGQAGGRVSEVWPVLAFCVVAVARALCKTGFSYKGDGYRRYLCKLAVFGAVP